MLEFFVTYRFDIYIVIAVVCVIVMLPVYAGNLACASYIKAMVSQFLASQDAEANASGAKINGTLSSRRKTMRKKIHKQAKAARKANRSAT
jgi:hypothetical protein